jgi:hypothetical protein
VRSVKGAWVDGGVGAEESGGVDGVGACVGVDDVGHGCLGGVDSALSLGLCSLSRRMRGGWGDDKKGHG